MSILSHLRSSARRCVGFSPRNGSPVTHLFQTTAEAPPASVIATRTISTIIPLSRRCSRLFNPIPLGLSSPLNDFKDSFRLSQMLHTTVEVTPVGFEIIRDLKSRGICFVMGDPNGMVMRKKRRSSKKKRRVKRKRSCNLTKADDYIISKVEVDDDNCKDEDKSDGDGDGNGNNEGDGDGNNEGAGGKGNNEGAGGKDNNEGAGDGNTEGDGDGNNEGAGDGNNEGAGDGNNEGAGDGNNEGAGDGNNEGAGDKDNVKGSGYSYEEWRLWFAKKDKKEIIFFIVLSFVVSIAGGLLLMGLQSLTSSQDTSISQEKIDAMFMDIKSCLDSLPGIVVAELESLIDTKENLKKEREARNRWSLKWIFNMFIN